MSPSSTERGRRWPLRNHSGSRSVVGCPGTRHIGSAKHEDRRGKTRRRYQSLIQGARARLGLSRRGVSRSSDRLSILLFDLVEAGLPEVFWGHARMKGHARVEVQEEWFGNGGSLDASATSTTMVPPRFPSRAAMRWAPVGWEQGSPSRAVDAALPPRFHVESCGRQGEASGTSCRRPASPGRTGADYLRFVVRERSG